VSKVVDPKGSKVNDPKGSKVNDPRAVLKTELTYNDYLKVPEILSLQQSLSTPPHHDELLFIVIHQTYELWFKIILHEIEKAMELMRQVEVLKAYHFFHRAGEIMKVLIQQIHILKTMTPVDFLQFRDQINPASGFQSLQFRELEFVCGLKDENYLKFFKHRPEYVETLRARLSGADIASVFYEMLDQLGFELPKNPRKVELEGSLEERMPLIEAIVPIFQKREQHLALHLLIEALVDLDEGLALWRENHWRVVERVIGKKPGTGGSSGVAYLETTTAKKCFPVLWEVRTHLRKSPT
jgi:tryptophan 2,3-dioxygenase